MKIIWTDNFDRDIVDERLVAQFEYQREAELCLKALQASCTEDGADWYKLVPDDYKLKKWEL